MLNFNHYLHKKNFKNHSYKVACVTQFCNLSSKLVSNSMKCIFYFSQYLLPIHFPICIKYGIDIDCIENQHARYDIIVLNNKAKR